MVSDFPLRQSIVAALLAVLCCLSTFEPAWGAVQWTDLSALPAGGSCAATATAAGIPGSAVEPRLAVGPVQHGGLAKRLVGVWIQNGGLWIGAAQSDNSGSSWRSSILPFTSCAPGGLQFGQVVDPWVSIASNGLVYASALAETWTDSAAGPILVAAAVVAAQSRDGGRSWRRARIVDIQREPNGLQTADDKPAILADSRHPDRAYVVWHRANPGEFPEGWFAKTADGGKTWSTPRRIVPHDALGSGAFYHQLVEDPRTGTLSDIFNWVRPNNGVYDGFIALVQSRDGGRTWSKPRVIADDLAIGIVAAPGGQLTVGPGIDSTVDSLHGTIYVVWTDARFSGMSHDDVVLSRSTDGGKHWSKPSRVSSVATAFDPTVSVDRHGDVGVTYYDLQTTDASGATIPVEYWFTRSNNRGHTFSAETAVAEPFDAKAAPYIGGYFLGDYEGLVGLGTRFRVLFSAHGTGVGVDVLTGTVR